ncbi:MAG: hypothetical protein GTO02_08350 [Candidatus Dadabacteria bacterium]|nr:hypothetical protein [Candidatus Dadabacteria bacterium]NIQ14397.1 hypothetical protein [Candidatus Dadabacteria bacterium]
MKTSSKKFAAIFLLLAFSLSSCVLLRILKVRDQLKNFNENFEIKDNEGLELVFKKPILSGNDMKWIMKSNPTNIENMQSYDLWTFYLVKRYKKVDQELGDFDIPLKMKFVNKKLISIIFPKRFLKYFSESTFEKFMSSMGDTEVKKIRKVADSSIDTLLDEEIPTTKEILEVLGIPYKTEFVDEIKTYTYKYRSIKRNDKGKYLKIKFVMNFDRQSDKLSSLNAVIRGAKINIDFSNFK